MATQTRREFVIVGSGPGGATLARELARAGRDVLLLERGEDHRRRPWYGTYLGALVYCDRMSLLFTEEGLNIVRPLMLGGATSMFCGCAAPPPDWLKGRYGIDIDDDVARAVDELEIRPLPPELRGRASTRVAEAAGSLGWEWFPQPKFMTPERSTEFRCTASCMLGCRCGAKWNAAEWVDEAVACGAELLTGARVSRVLVEGGRARGVEGTAGGAPLSVEAENVILCAGGIGTPRIMQASGFDEAGAGMAMDTTVMVYGFVDGPGTGAEPPMTWSWENAEDGYMLSTLTDPWLLYPLINARLGLRHALSWYDWHNVMGIMIKLKDDVSGGVFPGGRISKPMNPRERRRQTAAMDVCRRILVEAGADPGFIFMTPQRGTHPSATVRIGTMLDDDLQSEARGLYACDASVFPEALDRPTVLTIIGLAMRLARHLLSG
ncbi:MAG: GMC family oxidoreductase [Deltaproteobacteria bacterium]|nr:GMC family oxidoreductase [Deltaproteobacteria bacterium]